MYAELFDALGIGDGWEIDAYGDLLTCPCGYTIEIDGRCPSGCVSPLRELGLI